MVNAGKLFIGSVLPEIPAHISGVKLTNQVKKIWATKVL